MEAVITILGSGTSMGVPTLGCDCRVCTSPDPRDKRTRPSIRIEFQRHSILIDTGPDFHAQALREGVRHVDAVFYTHAHADHILGLDDLRPLSFQHKHRLPLYADTATADVIERIFDYTFSSENKYPTSARVSLHRITHPQQKMELFGTTFQAVPLIHGDMPVTGYRFGKAAYLTDLSDIPDSSLPLLHGLDVLIIDALRPEPHPSHSHLEKSIDFVEKIRPRQAWFTHIAHQMLHEETDAALPANIHLAYDGLRIPFEI
jgi:phosphoribosyl 1,2-cyclic phosphate phosphodiesterase